MNWRDGGWFMVYTIGYTLLVNIIVMKKNFEEFLQEKFIEQFTGTKDQYEVAEEHWFEQLDVSELIDYGQMFAVECYQLGLEGVISPYKVACERHGNSTVKEKNGRCPLCESIKVKGLYE